MRLFPFYSTHSISTSSFIFFEEENIFFLIKMTESLGKVLNFKNLAAIYRANTRDIYLGIENKSS